MALRLFLDEHMSLLLVVFIGCQLSLTVCSPPRFVLKYTYGHEICEMLQRNDKIAPVFSLLTKPFETSTIRLTNWVF